MIHFSINLLKEKNYFKTISKEKLPISQKVLLKIIYHEILKNSQIENIIENYHVDNIKQCKHLERRKRNLHFHKIM